MNPKLFKNAWLAISRSTPGITAGIFTIVLVPILFLAVFSLAQMNRYLTEQAWMRRTSIAHISAAVVEEKFDRLVAIGESLATRVRFREQVEAGKWDEAGEILKDIPQHFSEIERIFVCDPSGVLRTDTPALAGVRGRNFSERDWYRGLTRGWRPYVSEIYTRTAEPKLNVIAVAVPVLNSVEVVAAILVLQVRVEVIFQWSEEIEVGQAGFLFVTDAKGHLAAHPKLDPQAGIENVENHPVVRKLLGGGSGIEAAPDPISGDECLMAYETVPGYGWGVLAEEPTETVYAVRNFTLTAITVIYLFVLFVAGAMAFWVSKILARNISLSRQLRAHTGELEYANRELEAFSSSVAHDLRAPLRAIVSFSEILKEDEEARLSEQGRTTLERVVAAGHRMQEMIESLLALSKVNHWQLERRKIEMARLVHEVIGDLKTEIVDRKLEFKIGELAECEADPTLLRQVFQNLVSNAIKYTRRRPVAVIEVGSRIEEGERVWFVKDNGAGFNMEHAKRLFRVFERLHRQDEFEGIGLGLALVQRIIRRHGGRIWATAEVGAGATFFFTLSAADPDKPVLGN